MRTGLLLFLVCNIGGLTSLAQSTESYSDILEARKQSVFLNYTDSQVAQILTGRKLFDHNIQVKQLFLGKRTVEGTLVFDGVLFKDIELQYNLYTQQVIVLLETENSERYVTVTPDKVSRFSIYGHEFTQVSDDSVMEKGIYELAYAGANSSVFIKRTNNKLQTIERSKVNVEYLPINKYYVKNKFGTFHITGKKKLLEAYRDSEQLNSILKEYRIKLSKKKIEQDLVAAIAYLEANTADNNL